MAGTASPNPARRWLLILLVLIAVLAGLGSLVVRSTQPKPLPHWVELTTPLIMAIFGLMYSLFPEQTAPGLSPVWRRRWVFFFFAMSALMLILFFV